MRKEPQFFTENDRDNITARKALSKNLKNILSFGKDETKNLRLKSFENMN